jgi:hypothetical protein
MRIVAGFATRTSYATICIMSHSTQHASRCMQGSTERGKLMRNMQEGKIRVVLRNALLPADVPHEAERQALHDDILHEVSKYAVPLSLKVPMHWDALEEGQESERAWSGDVLLDYDNELSAQRVAEALQGSMFGDKPIEAQLEQPPRPEWKVLTASAR